MMNGQTYGDAGQQRGSSTANGNGARIPTIDETRKPRFRAGEYRAAHFTSGVQGRKDFGLREHRPAYRQVAPDSRYDLPVSISDEIKRRVDRTDWAGIANTAENGVLFVALSAFGSVLVFRFSLWMMWLI
jgi:hypothetical protein